MTGQGEQVASVDVRWLYHTDYYDGPLAGVVDLRGERLRVSFIDATPLRLWSYQLYRMPAEWWAAEDAKHALFREHVGTHTDYFYDDDGDRCRSGEVRPTTEHHKFYDRYPPRQTWADPGGEPVAWYVEG